MLVEADGPDWILLCGCGAVVVGYAWALIRYRTALLGLSAVNVFASASATLSAFVFGTLFDQFPGGVSPDHLEVVSYSVLGLLAMVAGIHLAWRPLRRTAGDPFRASLINQRVGWLTFVVGSVAELIIPFTVALPTVSTAVYCMAKLGRIGLAILLVAAIREERWNRFLLALGVSISLSFASSLSSGFSFIRLTTVLPLVAIWISRSGVTARNALLVAVLLPVGLTTMAATTTAWLATRSVIRMGELEHLPVASQAKLFVASYWSNLEPPTAETVMKTLRERVDMTDILIAQARYQPDLEPYAYGETVLSSFFTLIPRVFWRDKPSVAGGSEFVSRFTGLTWNESTSVGLPYPFELYANGGPLLVILGLGVIGYGGARLELKLTSPTLRLGSFWALALATAVITDGGQRTEVVLPAIVSSALVAYAVGTVIDAFGLVSQTSVPIVVRDTAGPAGDDAARDQPL